MRIWGMNSDQPEESAGQPRWTGLPLSMRHHSQIASGPKNRSDRCIRRCRLPSRRRATSASARPMTPSWPRLRTSVIRYPSLVALPDRCPPCFDEDEGPSSGNPPRDDLLNLLVRASVR